MPALKTARNPLHYGTHAEGEHFAGRDSELATLASRLHTGINVVLVSPRRAMSASPSPGAAS